MNGLLKRYWDIIGGTVAGVGLSYLASWQMSTIQLYYSIIILVLVCIGLFKVLKTSIEKHILKNHLGKHKGEYERRKILIDKAVDGQKPMKAIKMANEPTATGEELGYAILDTLKGSKKLMSKLKKVFVWIKDYWQQIIGLLGTFLYACLVIYAYIFDKFDFVLQYLPEGDGWTIGTKIVVGVLSVIFVFFSVRNQVKWVGVGSITTAQTYLQALADGKASKLSDTAKNKIKVLLKNKKSELKTLNSNLATFTSKLEEVNKNIEDMKELMSINTSFGNSATLNDYYSQKTQLTNQINEVTASIKTVEETITQCENAL